METFGSSLNIGGNLWTSHSHLRKGWRHEPITTSLMYCMHVVSMYCVDDSSDKMIIPFFIASSPKTSFTRYRSRIRIQERTRSRWPRGGVWWQTGMLWIALCDKEEYVDYWWSSTRYSYFLLRYLALESIFLTPWSRDGRPQNHLPQRKNIMHYAILFVSGSVRILQPQEMIGVWRAKRECVGVLRIFSLIPAKRCLQRLNNR